MALVYKFTPRSKPCENYWSHRSSELLFVTRSRCPGLWINAHFRADQMNRYKTEEGFLDNKGDQSQRKNDAY